MDETVQNTLTVCDLPEELLVYILSHLSFYDRKMARLVCKRFNEVSYSFTLIKNDWLVLPSDVSLEQLQNRPEYWNFYNLRMKEKTYPWGMHCVKKVETLPAPEKTNVWERYGSHINKLQLEYISRKNPVLVDILKYCTNLRSLALTVSCSLHDEQDGISFAESAPFSLSKLECLELSGYGLTDGEFIALTESALNLIELYLCFYEDYVKISSIVDLVKRQSERLTHLRMPSNIPEDSQIEIISSIGSQMKYLKIRANANLQGKAIQAISENWPNIGVFDLYLSNMDKENLPALLRLLKNAGNILIDVGNDFANSLDVMTNLEFLSEINLAGSGVQRSEIMKLGRRWMPNMKVLNLNNVSCVDDQVLMNISPKFPNLIKLSLDNTHFGNVGFDSIVKHHKLLEYLSMNECKSIREIIPGINQLTELRTLSLRWCKGIRPHTSITYLYLRKLRNLSVNGFYVNNNFKNTLRQCPSLEHVHVYSMYLDDSTEFSKMIRPTFHVEGF